MQIGKKRTQKWTTPNRHDCLLKADEQAHFLTQNVSKYTQSQKQRNYFEVVFLLDKSVL